MTLSLYLKKQDAMRTKSLLSIIACAAAAMFMQQCSTPDHTSGFIKRPFENVDVAANNFEMNADKANTFSLPNGTSIQVPANAFVDADGNVIKGKVKISYREFHNAADIIASGIPMKYDSAGTSSDFITAGMFEMNGSCNGSEVFISNDKSITVNMASFAGGSGYNFYALDKDKGNWIYQGKVSPQENLAKKAKMEVLGEKPTQPVMPEKYDGKAFVFDLDLDYKHYPELKELNGIVWQYAGKNEESDPSKNSALFNQRWTNVQLTPTGEGATFELTLSNYATSCKTTVKPVLKGKSYEKALVKFQQKMKVYNEKLQARSAEEARLKSEADLIRSFSVKSFGIYNWDMQYKNPDVIRVAANFEFDKPVDTDINKVDVYMIIGDGRAVIRYPQYDWERFSFKPGDENKLIAVLPGNKVAVFTDSDFKKIDVSRIQDGQGYTFRLKTIDKKISSLNDLDKVLASL